MAHNHPERVYVVRTSFWAGHSDWEDPPVAARSRDGRNYEKLWRTASLFWSLIEVDIHSSQRISLFTNATSSDQSSNLQNHLSRHLASSHSTLHINEFYLLIYKQLLYFLTQRSVSVLSQAIPQATRSRDQSQDIVQLTTPLSRHNTGTNLPEEGEQKKSGPTDISLCFGLI